jgi:hypothetical protein
LKTFGFSGITSPVFWKADVYEEKDSSQSELPKIGVAAYVGGL